jgi:hypothetical protein
MEEGGADFEKGDDDRKKKGQKEKRESNKLGYVKKVSTQKKGKGDRLRKGHAIDMSDMSL